MLYLGKKIYKLLKVSKLPTAKNGDFLEIF